MLHNMPKLIIVHASGYINQCKRNEIYIPCRIRPSLQWSDRSLQCVIRFRLFLLVISSIYLKPLNVDTFRSWNISISIEIGPQPAQTCIKGTKRSNRHDVLPEPPPCLRNHKAGNVCRKQTMYLYFMTGEVGRQSMDICELDST